jgi:uncharacterized small protein (DUF1192 family)
VRNFIASHKIYQKHFSHIDRLACTVNISAMDMEENLPRKANDPLALLISQDLDPFSVAELAERVALLEGEIARTRQKMTRAVNHKASADALFRK